MRTNLVQRRHWLHLCNHALKSLATIAIVALTLTMPPAFATPPPLISGGSNYNCALQRAEGSVLCWGDGAMVAGPLGGPVRNPTVMPGLSRIVALGSGFAHQCVLDASGRVQCWGDNIYGAVSHPDTNLRAINIPYTVAGIGSPAIEVFGAPYGDHSCAINTAFTAYCWGRNQRGQLGSAVATNVSAAPVAVAGLGAVATLALGGEHSCAATLGGAMRCWGRNREGQLGNGTAVDSAAVVDVAGLSGGVRAIAAGYFHSCAVVSNGRVKCWGSNEYGELGNGGATGSGARSALPVDVVGISDAIDVVAGRYFTCALRSGGGVRCWGDNTNSALGNGSSGGRIAAPVDVTGLAAPAIALTSGGFNPCAVLVSGAVQCWGYKFGTASTRATEVAGLAIDTTVPLAEFRHADLDYYFRTSRYQEKILLNTAPSFQATAELAIPVYASALQSGTRGIERYYFSQVARGGSRGSHFYTLVDAEKNALQGLNPSNADVPRLPQSEGIDSFAFLPVIEGVGGTCAAGQSPVYRLFRGNARFPDDPNHRFTTNLTTYNIAVAAGWDGEGVKFCAVTR